MKYGEGPRRVRCPWFMARPERPHRATGSLMACRHLHLPSMKYMFFYLYFSFVECETETKINLKLNLNLNHEDFASQTALLLPHIVPRGPRQLPYMALKSSLT